MTLAALLHIPTVYLLTGFGSLVGAVILLWLRREHRESSPALSLFAAGIFTLGVGFMAFAAREPLTGWLAPLVGYAGFGICAVLIWLGSRQLYGHPRTEGLTLMAGLVLVGYVVALFALREPSANAAIARISLSSAFVVVFMGLAAFESHRSHLIASLRSVRLMRALLILFGALVTVRAIMFLAHGIALDRKSVV